MILLVDMDAFYASVHQAEDDSLKSRPVLIGGDTDKRRGVVTTASYEARARGVKPPMPLWKALQICPDGVVIPPDFSLYHRYSSKVMEILLKYSPIVEQASIDEAYVDVEGSVLLFGSPETIAGKIKAEIFDSLGLRCSIGIGENKLLAKMAAEICKPDGLMVLKKEEVPDVLWPLPARELYGVGPKTADKLKTMGILTIGDLARMPERTARSSFGKYGLYLRNSARGEGSTQVDPKPRQPKSVGQQTTLPKDVYSAEGVRAILRQQAVEVCRRLRRSELACTIVRVGIKDRYFHYYTRQRKLDEATSDPNLVHRTAMGLVEAHFPPEGIRMIGVTAAGLVKKDPDVIGNLIDTVEGRFGRGSLTLGMLKDYGEKTDKPGGSGDE